MIKAEAGRQAKQPMQDTSTPRALLYSDVAARVEGQIAEALPEIVETMIAAAKGGDLATARYLVDRILGRQAGAKMAPIEDRTLPFTEEDAERERSSKAMFAGMAGF